MSWRGSHLTNRISGQRRNRACCRRARSSRRRRIANERDVGIWDHWQIETRTSLASRYRAARVCYAYLSGVPGSNLDDESIEKAFRSSKWFTRGCTFQGLLAPDHLVFYDIAWAKIGGKENLAKLVKSITGTHHLFAFHQASVAQKISWAVR